VHSDVKRLVEDLGRRRQTSDRLSDTLDDIEAAITQSETTLADISQATNVTESQRLKRLSVSASRQLYAVVVLVAGCYLLLML